MDEKIIESKTKRKQNMINLQKLGIELIGVSKKHLLELNLSDTLIDTILLAKEINGNEAKRRIYQYIGKLMRDVDENAIKQKLLELNSDSVSDIRLTHLCESWRDKLLTDVIALDIFIDKYHPQNIKELRELLKLVKKEKIHGHDIAYKKLFKLIRSILILE